MKITRLICALIAVAAASAGASAQNGTMTPYSRYGYGILSDNASAAQRQMGGTGYAMHSGRTINVMNPASYARIDSMTFLFDMGVDLTCLWNEETVDGVRNRSNDFGGGLDYITMQFPLTRGLGMSVGLLPYASTGYAFGNTIENGYDSRSGSGSINQVYAGIGYMPFKGLSVGANVAYMFGMTYNDSYAVTSGGNTSLFERQLSVSDWSVNVGLQYSVAVGRRDLLTFGAVFTPGKNFHGNVEQWAYDQSLDSAPTESEEGIDGRYSSPWSLGVGLGYTFNDRLTVEVDGTYQPWSKAKYNGETGVLNDRYKISAGMQWTPNPRGSYFRRANYRLGAFYNRDYLRVLGNELKDFGIGAGMGFPVPGFKTIVNVGVEWRHRQGSPNALIKENYLNITLGVNFNEMWFRPNKIY
ncbi:MAG: hypothetical protein K2F97_05420 [Muribaculaceae bacterium]|nr:hypothetical protein [Muribaculaceae bacterium]